MMKRAFFSASAFCFIFLCAKDVSAKNIGEVGTNGANLITAPTLNSDVIEEMSPGQAVEIINSKDDFYKVRVDGFEAYTEKKPITPISTEGIVNAERVNIRALPFEDSQIISQANIGDKVNINSVTGDWLAIEFDNNTAYISKKFVICDYINELQKTDTPSHKIATVTSDNGLNLRQESSINSAAVSAIPYNGTVNIIDDKVNNDWIKVAYDNKIGYVNSNYIEVLDDAKHTSSVSNKTKAEQIIDYAKKFIGTKYIWGGRDLNTGVDCSGFTYCVMRKFGISLNNTSATQVYNGKPINNRHELQPGDLVFFSNNGSSNIHDIQHVGIYIGNSQFIHSGSTGSKGVMISSLNETYYTRNYVTARRVI